MIQPEEVIQLIQMDIPDAQVEITDKTGMSDHYRIKVLSKAFTGKNPLDRHRMVYDAVGPAMQTGRLHAVEITTLIPE